jgi:hypothetical protein
MSHPTPVATHWPNGGGANQKTKPINVMTSIFGECLCQPFPFSDARGLSPNSQFLELHGIEFIGS